MICAELCSALPARTLPFRVTVMGAEVLLKVNGERGLETPIEKSGLLWLLTIMPRLKVQAHS
jgi:hypothetical protein